MPNFALVYYTSDDVTNHVIGHFTNEDEAHLAREVCSSFFDSDYYHAVEPATEVCPAHDTAAHWWNAYKVKIGSSRNWEEILDWHHFLLGQCEQMMAEMAARRAKNV